MANGFYATIIFILKSQAEEDGAVMELIFLMMGFVKIKGKIAVNL